MTKRLNGEGSIYKYPHGFRAYVWVNTPDGHRARKYVTGKTHEIVRTKLAKLRAEAARGPVATSNPTIAGYLNAWLDEVVRPTLAPTTVLNYAMFIRLYIVPNIGSKRLDRLSVRDVQTWVNALRVSCQCCDQDKDRRRANPRCCAIGMCCEQTPSEWTVRQAWAVLSAGLAQAVREELLTRNVAAMVRMPMPRSRKRTVWSVDDVKEFLQNSLQEHDPLHAAYVLMLVLGLRRGELLGLSWQDVDLEKGEAQIQWQIQRISGELVRRPTKTESSDATLPLPDICIDALRAHRAMTNRWKLKAGESWQESGLVFTTRYGLAIDPRNFNRSFKRRAQVASVPVIPVHSTRRTCASLLVELGVHPRVAMAIMRHSQIAVTMNIYSQVASSSAREALSNLGARLAEGGHP